MDTMPAPHPPGTSRGAWLLDDVYKRACVMMQLTNSCDQTNTEDRHKGLVTLRVVSRSDGICGAMWFASEASIYEHKEVLSMSAV